MHTKGNLLFSLFLIGIAGYAAFSAWNWSFKTGFFPLSLAIPLIILVVVHLVLEAVVGSEKTSGPAVETEFANEVPPEVARRRVVEIFSWIAGFILLVFLLGFPAAVPLFMISYLTMQSRIGWLQSITLTAGAWGFFYFLFQRLLNLQFEAGVIQTWMGL
jgi:putative tricarboxylic transport membrane protein